jgi:hypothetical protein
MCCPKNTFLFMYVQIMMISCLWFGLIGRYKFGLIGLHELIPIIVSMRFHHLISQIRLSHAHDLVLLVVINRGVCLESRFDPHIDTNYCVHKIFIKCLNISLCLPYVRHIFMFKLNDVITLTWSCWWLQIGLWETFVSSHDSAPT